MINILLVVFIFLFVILWHEFGHFSIAKMIGVKVTARRCLRELNLIYDIQTGCSKGRQKYIEDIFFFQSSHYVFFIILHMIVSQQMKYAVGKEIKYFPLL